MPATSGSGWTVTLGAAAQLPQCQEAAHGRLGRRRRLNPNRTGSTPFHDVQAQLEGRAALDVYAVLRSRWQDHPDRPPTVFLPVLGVTAVTGTHRARVTATFGDPQQFAGLLGPPYLFAPQGSTATRQLLMHLIAKARSYIYVEDQYFVDPSVGAALAAAMPHLRALFVVVPTPTPSTASCTRRSPGAGPPSLR